jgi:hypothetical protein
MVKISDSYILLNTRDITIIVFCRPVNPMKRFQCEWPSTINFRAQKRICWTLSTCRYQIYLFSVAIVDSRDIQRCKISLSDSCGFQYRPKGLSLRQCG